MRSVLVYTWMLSMQSMVLCSIRHTLCGRYTGGANIPALNELLASFGIAFGDAILEGQVPLDPDKPYYASGANIVRFPAGGHLHSWQLADKATEGVLHACLPTCLLGLGPQASFWELQHKCGVV